MKIIRSAPNGPPRLPNNANFLPVQNQQPNPFQQGSNEVAQQFLVQQNLQPINMSNRVAPPPVPNFTPAQNQFFAPQQFQLSSNMGPPQQVQDSQLQRAQGANFQAAPSRLDPRFSAPEFDSSNPRFRQEQSLRRPTRQADNQEPSLGPTGGTQAQNAAVVQQLINKLSQENNLMFRARQMLDNLSPRNCSVSRFAEKVDLGFSQEFNRKIAKQFATQARSALRLSHFLSNYLQNGIIVDGRRKNKLTENMILGEMAAMIIAEPATGAVSMQFEESVFPGRRFFAPTALYNKMLDELQFYHYPGKPYSTNGSTRTF